MKKANLILKDGTTIDAESFGYETSIAGEVVFATGMVGYPEAFTDPSFAGQILVMTYPLLGSYGVANNKTWESDKLQISGLIVSDYIDTPSHFGSERTLGKWLKDEKIPGLVIKDTRGLAQHLRQDGVMLGKIIIDKDTAYYDPNTDDLLSKVSVQNIQIHNNFEGKELPSNAKTVILMDCGAKRNIIRCFLKRGVKVIQVPWDYDVFSNRSELKFDGFFISNGPGDPKMAKQTIATTKKALENKIPTLGICLGNQLLALAAGGDTYKLKFGHRSQNQPCLLEKTNKCFITTQNHGFAVGKIPDGFKPWFMNANDNTNEGIIHESLPFFSTQFHPEAHPGPEDTEWVFDYFIEKL
ncbi:MAG: glutamine-hydrolyzing carbamoyl-phosphate synthase small subunit [Candidatus Levyibacteriota bacterium]